MGILRNYEIEILPVSYYDAVKRRIEEEQAKAEAAKQAELAAAQLAASNLKVAERSASHAPVRPPAPMSDGSSAS